MRIGVYESGEQFSPLASPTSNRWFGHSSHRNRHQSSRDDHCLTHQQSFGSYGLLISVLAISIHVPIWHISSRRYTSGSFRPLLITYFFLYDQYIEANVSENAQSRRKLNLTVKQCNHVNLNWILKMGLSCQPRHLSGRNPSQKIGKRRNCSLFQSVMSQYHENRRHPCSAAALNAPAVAPFHHWLHLRLFRLHTPLPKSKSQPAYQQCPSTATSTSSSLLWFLWLGDAEGTRPSEQSD